MRQSFSTCSAICKSVAAGCAFTCWIFTSVYAAPPSAEDLASLTLEELSKVKVTSASLFAHTKLDTPASVSVLTEQEWQGRGARQITDVFGYLASMYTIPIAFAVRGISIRGLPLNGNSGVLTELDGVPIISLVSSNTLPLNLGTLQSMEILHGPGSALHGTNAFHGVIALHSFQAQEDRASMEGFAASDGYYQSTARFSSRLGSVGRGSVAVSVNGQPDQHLAYSYTDAASQTTLFGERENRYSAQSAVFNLNSDQSESWSYSAGVHLNRYDAQKFPGYGTALAGERDTSDLNAKFYLARLGISKQFTPQQSLGFGSYYWTLAIDNTRVAKNAGVFTEGASVLDEHRAGIRALYKDHIGDDTQLAFGVNYAEQVVGDATQMTLSDVGVVLRSVNQPFAGAMRKTSSALFEGNSGFYDHRLNITYGARYDTYSDVTNHFSPRVGVIYHPQIDTAIKLLYGHAHRAPTVLETYGAAESIQGDPNLAAETFDTVELVWLKQALDWHLQLSTFHSALQNGIVNIANPAPPPLLRAANLGSEKANGLELEWQVQRDHWYAKLNSAYIATDSDVIGEFTTIPKWVAVIGLGYALPVLHTDLSLIYRVQSRVDDTVANGTFAPTRLRMYSRADLQITSRLSSQTKLWLTARNLFARNNRVPSSPAAQYGVQDEAFSIGVGVSYGW